MTEETLRPRLRQQAYDLVKGTGNRILIVGDLHAPFIRDGYFKFCCDIYEKYNCNQVIFTGDIMDNHYTSFHDTDPDGFGAGEELLLARHQISNWYNKFPEAKVCLGNHDLIPQRKAFNAGISDRWLKDIREVLNTPKWEYSDNFYIDGVQFTHGTNKKAKARAKSDLISVVQGHYHSESYLEFFVGKNFKIFAMQLGCGVDGKAYSMAYGKNFAKNHINCGVIINGMPIIEYMDL